MKRVRFWGTRGSRPVPPRLGCGEQARRGVLLKPRSAAPSHRADIERLRRRPAVCPRHLRRQQLVRQIETGGPGLRGLRLGSGCARSASRRWPPRAATPQTFHVFMSHLHWDHIMGLPVLRAGLHPGQPGRDLRQPPELEGRCAASRSRRPSRSASTPSSKAASSSFTSSPASRAGAGVRVTTMLQRHTGDSTATASSRRGAALVYSTDSEHPLADPAHTERFVEFFRDADLVIFDAMPLRWPTPSVKADWGHSATSSASSCAKLAHGAAVPVPPRAGVRRRRIEAVLAETRHTWGITAARRRCA